jgi:hypothetical protein
MADTAKKEFSLKPVETQMLQVVQQQMTTIITNLLSMYALERLNHPVTENTRFEISPDMKSVRIWEHTEEPETPPAPSDTAKAIKGK